MFTLPEKREIFITLNWQFPINDNSGSLVDLESMKFCHVYFTFFLRNYRCFLRNAVRKREFFPVHNRSVIYGKKKEPDLVHLWIIQVLTLHWEWNWFHFIINRNKDLNYTWKNKLQSRKEVAGRMRRHHGDRPNMRSKCNLRHRT